MIKKIAILGFGREGKSILKFLKRGNPGANITILDQKFDKNYLKNLSRFDLIFRSPGVPYNLLQIQKAVKAGVKFSSSTTLFFEFASKRKYIRTIGITGTKGKGTTSTLLYKILKACGKQAYLAGNIGKPAIELLSSISVDQRTHQCKSASIAILELSSFQLQDMNYSPNIAVILDIFPDHLDLHKNFKEYLGAKNVISKFQNSNDKIFYFADNKYSRFIARKSRGRKFSVSTKNFKLFKPEDLKIPGEHNFKNAVMAANVALSLGCPKEKVIKTVKKFRGLEHRLELVRTIKIANQSLIKFVNIRESYSRRIREIRFYNDSASTNPQTAAAAIKAFKEPKTRAFKTLSARPSAKRDTFSALILISGGKDKGLNYSPLSQALKNSNTKLVILFGENKKKIYKAISGQRLAVREVKTLKDAVNLAYKFAKSLIAIPYTLNPIILLSPASASFDIFKDYTDRGEKFKKLVKNLKC
jgi:UDP-N-acetylmuramoylalanine--D-glutamate ligase